MTTCSPAFSLGFTRTCLQAGIPVKVASLWLWRKRMGEAMEKPAFAQAFMHKAASVADAPLPVVEKVAKDRSVIADLSERIGVIDKQAAAATDPVKHTSLMLTRDVFQRRLNDYILAE